MRKIKILPIVIVIAILAITSIAAADFSGRRFTTTLTGEAEVNEQGEPNQGDLDGIGTATIWLNPGQEQVCWRITVSGITLPATAAHIHEAPVTAPGPVVIPLSAPDESGFAEGCTSASREEIKEIIQHPEEYYVNVHNADFPAGALRGQLSK